MESCLKVERIEALPFDLDTLLMASLTEGFRGLQRLEDDWLSGANRFALLGEALFAARLATRLVGICGINRDPYRGDAVSRLRHLYVARDQRRQHVGSALVAAVLEHARRNFQAVSLRTDRADADHFYRALGFLRIDGAPACTHFLSLEMIPSMARR